MNNKFNFDFELFESFLDMCFIISDSGEILTLNNAVYDTLHIVDSNLAGQNFFDLVEPSFITKTKSLLSQSIKNKKAESTYSKFKSGGRIFDVDLFFAPLPTAAKQSVQKRSFVLAKDITAVRLREIELMRFYYVAQNTVNPVQIADLQGKMVYVNPAFVNASGYSKEELIGKNPNIFSSGKHSKKFWTKMWNTISSGKVWVGEVENKSKSGEPFYTQLLVSPILDHEGKVTGYFGIHRDLSEKKLLEKQLIHTQKMESIGTLAAGVAHEVGNPLASISALVQVVQRSTTDEFAKEKLELIKKQVTRISKIIRDLVDFSRPSNYELQLTDINQNIVEAVEIIKVGAKAKDIVFDLDLNNKIPLLPLISDQIQQIFVNILLNAVDAISENIENNKKNKISVLSNINDDEVIISFNDTGKGINEEHLSKVFEPFYTTKKEGKGTGLGLWVSYGIVKSFQGEIKVESKLKKGTTFTITLPIQP
jgi:PAS domain S-box-containing protein